MDYTCLEAMEVALLDWHNIPDGALMAHDYRGRFIQRQVPTIMNDDN